MGLCERLRVQRLMKLAWEQYGVLAAWRVLAEHKYRHVMDRARWIWQIWVDLGFHGGRPWQGGGGGDGGGGDGSVVVGQG